MTCCQLLTLIACVVCSNRSWRDSRSWPGDDMALAALSENKVPRPSLPQPPCHVRVCSSSSSSIQRPQLESVHVTAMRTLQQLRESADPAVAPFAAAAAELFISNSMAAEGRMQQRNLGLMGTVLMDQIRGSAASAAVHD